ncbi:peptidase associated/transthyretin-like domain-containing protein [Hymenobacter tenuis]
MPAIRFYIGIGLLPFLGLNARAQGIAGKVVDAKTGQAVPYASVGVLGTAKGTTGNAEGEFVLSAGPQSRLVVSELSHRPDTVQVTGSQPLLIRLQPAAVELPDVQPGAYTAELLKKAYRHLQHANRPRYGQAFYRQTTQLNNDPTEVQEMVWHTKASGIGIEETAPYQGRYAKKKAVLNFKDFSAFTKSVVITSLAADSTTSTLLLSLNPNAANTLRLLGIRQDGDRELAEIGFADKAKPEQKYGSFLIDVATYQILRFRVTGQFINASASRSAYEFAHQSTSAEWVFHPADNGSTVLSYIKVDYQSTLQQPRKPAVDVHVSAFTVFYDDQAAPAPGITYRPYKPRASDLQTIKELAYDPVFWQNNSAVKRTPLEEATIKAFEQKGAFGTMLTP